MEIAILKKHEERRVALEALLSSAERDNAVLREQAAAGGGGGGAPRGILHPLGSLGGHGEYDELKGQVA